MSRIRTVFDTNVFIKVYLHFAIRGEKWPYTAILHGIFDDVILPLYSRPTMDELMWKLTRGRDLLKRFPIDPTHAEYYVKGLFYELGEFVEVKNAPVDGRSSDPDDRLFEQTAILGHADFLVSEDCDLHEKAVIELLHAHGVRVVNARTYASTIL